MSVLYLFTEAFFMMSDFTLLSDNSNICIIMVLASLDLSLGTWGQHSGEYPGLSFCLTHPSLGHGEASNLEKPVNTGQNKNKNKPQENPAVLLFLAKRKVYMCLFYVWCPGFCFVLFFFVVVLGGKSRIIHLILEPEEKCWCEC